MSAAERAAELRELIEDANHRYYVLDDPDVDDAVYDDWMRELLYWDWPAWAFVVMYTLFALLVLGTWWLVPPARSR